MRGVLLIHSSRAAAKPLTLSAAAATARGRGGGVSCGEFFFLYYCMSRYRPLAPADFFGFLLSLQVYGSCRSVAVC